MALIPEGGFVMSIDAISSSSSSSQTSAMQTNFLQIRKLLEQLGQALQSGDLSGAQKAFASLQQLLPSSSESTNLNVVA